MNSVNSVKAADPEAKAGRLVARTAHRMLESVTTPLQQSSLACLGCMRPIDCISLEGAAWEQLPG